MAFLTNSVAERYWLEITKLTVPLVQLAILSERPHLVGCTTWAEGYHSALTDLIQAAVISNHCGQHIRNRETLPIHLTLPDLSCTAGLTFVRYSAALTLPASVLHIAGRTTGDSPQARRENHRQCASSLKNKLLSYWTASLFRRRERRSSWLCIQYDVALYSDTQLFVATYVTFRTSAFSIQ